MVEQKELREEQKIMKKELTEVKDIQESQMRIAPKTNGKITKNVKSAVAIFLDKYGLDYKAWAPLAFKAHGTYITNYFEVSCRADILMKDGDEAIRISKTVNENFWKVKALLTEAAINNKMPIKWEAETRNQYYEVIKYHIFTLKDLDSMSSEQIFREVAQRELMLANKNI